MKIFIEQTDERTTPRWEQINWHHVEKNVRRLQERIYRATERQEWKNAQRDEQCQEFRTEGHEAVPRPETLPRS